MIPFSFAFKRKCWQYIYMTALEKVYLFINDCYSKIVDHIDVDIKKSFLLYIDKDEEKANQYASSLLKAEAALKEDLDFFFEGDPAANTKEEIVLSYPGFLAIVYHRLAHPLYVLGYPVEARYISEQAHRITGIDIHPGAKIGVPFFIDHGTGIVIGETSIVGKRVKIYQGVTLGALSLGRGHTLKGTKRHPTIGDDVTIYSGVSILGDVTIGDDVTLGSNVFLTEDIPPHTKVIIAKPELIIKKKEQ